MNKRVQIQGPAGPHRIHSACNSMYVEKEAAVFLIWDAAIVSL